MGRTVGGGHGSCNDNNKLAVKKDATNLKSPKVHIQFGCDFAGLGTAGIALKQEYEERERQASFGLQIHHGPCH